MCGTGKTDADRKALSFCDRCRNLLRKLSGEKYLLILKQSPHNQEGLFKHHSEYDKGKIICHFRFQATGAMSRNDSHRQSATVSVTAKLVVRSKDKSLKAALNMAQKTSNTNSIVWRAQKLQKKLHLLIVVLFLFHVMYTLCI